MDINSTDASGIPAALAAVEWADVVVLAIGLDTVTIEHEGYDRPSIGLPGLQVGGHTMDCYSLERCTPARGASSDE